MNGTVTMNRDRLMDYGINLLTGEACSYSLRILCDLSEEGKQVITQWLGLKEDAFLENWNSYVGEKPAVASIMIPRGCFQDLYYWILVHVCGFEVVIESQDGSVTGMNMDHPYYKTYMDNMETMRSVYNRVARFPRNENSVAGRNVHQFTGRIA